MANNTKLDVSVIRAALQELDQLSRDEYGCRLEDLLLDPSPDSQLRVQRLVGIVLKRPFAKPGPASPNGRTRARRSWPWEGGEPAARSGAKEFALLNELRQPGPWNERKPHATPGDAEPITWDAFKDDADNERGLFKVLALYADDVLRKRHRRSIREYLDAEETPRFEAGLDLATLLFDSAVTVKLAAILGIPTLAVGVALVGIQYDFRRVTDNNVDRVGDRRS